MKDALHTPHTHVPHIEGHFESTETVRDIVIGLSDGLTVPFALAAGLTLTLAANARADNLTGYKIQSIVKLGDTVAGLKIRANGDFEFGTFNDNGQIALVGQLS